MSYVYLDIVVGDKNLGRIVIQLFEEKAPLAAENFKQLCQSKEYAKTYFHKVIRTFILQGGDTSIKDTDPTNEYPDAEHTGKNGNGKSIYNNDYFKDENLTEINKSFLLCMSNFNKKDHNKSQFFITLDKAPHLNGKHTVFGEVKYGKSVVREVEKVEVYTNKTNNSRAWIPMNKIIVDDCGIWEKGDPLPNSIACVDQIGGDIYEEYPDDNEIAGLDLENIEQTYKITSLIKESASFLFKSKRYNDAILKYKKSLRYCNELIPDEESNKEMYKKFQDLKKTIYLNLSLVTLTMQNYIDCITYCGYTLELEDVELSNTQTAKVFYRLGKCYASLKKYEIALETFKKGAAASPDDPSIKREMEIVEKIVTNAKNKEKANYAKFFK